MAARMAPCGLLPRPIGILSVSRLLLMVAYVVIGDRELKTPAEAETVHAMDKIKGSRDSQRSFFYKLFGWIFNVRLSVDKGPRTHKVKKELGSDNWQPMKN